MSAAALREMFGDGLFQAGLNLRGDGSAMLHDGNAEYPGSRLVENLGESIIWLAAKICPAAEPGLVMQRKIQAAAPSVPKSGTSLT